MTLPVLPLLHESDAVSLALSLLSEILVIVE